MKRFFYWLIRLLLRPVLSPAVPLWLQRFWSSAVGLALIGPRGSMQSRSTIAEVPTLCIQPSNARPGHGLLYLHGGGYVVGNARSHAKLAAWIGQAAGTQVWLPEYRLAPEHACPAALKDALAVYAALLAAGQNPAQLSIAGDSAGGGLALATAIAIRDSGLPLPRALVLLSPWLDLSLSGESVITHAYRDAMLKPDWLRACATAYRGNLSAEDPAASPLFANLHGLPPMLIHTGTEELLLSDSERLQQQARAAGIAARLHRYEGVGHVFQFHAGVLREANDSVEAIGDFIRGEFK